MASQFIVWDASAASPILAESSLHCSLSLASSVILTRSSVDWSLKWSISPRSLFSTIGRVVVGRPLSLWPYWMLCKRGCRCLYEEYAQRGSNGLLEFAARGAFPGIFLYSDFLVIFTGNLIFRTFFSCFRCNNYYKTRLCWFFFYSFP